MAYKITAGSHPDYYIVSYTGKVQTSEILIADELHFGEGRLIYILLDLSAK